MEVALVTSAKFQCSVYTVKSCEVSLSKKYRPISAYLWSLRLRAFLAVTKQWRHPQCWPTGCLIEQPHKDKVKDVQNVLKRRVACSHKVAKGLYIYVINNVNSVCNKSAIFSNNLCHSYHSDLPAEESARHWSTKGSTTLDKWSTEKVRFSCTST